MRAIVHRFFIGLALVLSFTASQAVQVSDFVSLGVKSGNSVTISCQGTHKVRFTFCTPSIVKVEFDPAGSFRPTTGDLIRAEFATRTWPAVNFTVVDTGYIRLQSSKITVRVQKSPFRIRYYDAANTTLITGDDASRGLASDSVDVPWVRLTKKSSEHFFGWGRVLNLYWSLEPLKLDKTGSYWQTDSFRVMHQNEAPFMFSTGGYGVFFLFDARAEHTSPVYDLRNAAYADYWPSKNPGVRPPYCAYYFIYGPSWRTVIDNYTLVSGRPHKLAKKWYGVQCDWYNFTKIFKMADFVAYSDSMRSGKFPCDVIRFDHMYDWGTVVNAAPAADYLAMLQHYRKLGFLTGGMCPSSGGGGCMGGNSALGITIPTNCTRIDDAAKSRTAVDRGFDFQWCDNTGFGFTYTEAKRMFEQWRDARNGDTTMAFVVKGWYSAVSQSFLGAHTGDGLWDCFGVSGWVPPCRDGYWRVVPGSLEQGLVGYHASFTDLGVRHDWNYIASAMRPAISFHNQGGAGGYGGCWSTQEENHVEPWNFPDSVKPLMRKWLALHYRFMPYLFTYAMIAHETGMPVWRHMMCHDPANPATWDKDMQAYVGENIIISPYFEDQATNVNSGIRKGIWLPEGTWYDYFEGPKFTGPTTIDYVVDPGTGTMNKKLPMFVRAGGIIPLMEPVQYIGERPETLITVQVWPSGSSSFNLYEDEKAVKTRIQSDHADGQKTTITLGAFAGGKYCVNPALRRYRLELHNVPKIYWVMSQGQLLPQITRADYDARKTGWQYDTAKGGICFVNATGDALAGFPVVASYVASGVPQQDHPGMQNPLAFVVIAQRGRTLMVSVPSARGYVIELFDVHGKRMVRRLGTGADPCSISMKAHAPAMYLLKISAQGRTIVKKVLLD